MTVPSFPRVRLRAGLVALLALVACAATTASASAAPAVSVDKTRVAPAGDTITVRGAGFDTAAPGIYVTWGPKNATAQDDFIEAKWVRAGGAGENELRADGTFKVTFDVAQNDTTAAGAAVDCAVVTDGCAVGTVKAHGVPDPTQSTSTSITFGPVIEVNRTQVLPSGDTILDVHGEGFAPTPADTSKGVYVAFGENSASPWTATNNKAAKWIRTGSGASGDSVMNADGSFDTKLTVAKEYTVASGPGAGAYDCAAFTQGCAINTYAAHGWGTSGGVLTYRGLDTVTPITFGPVLTVSPDPANANGDTVTVHGEGFGDNTKGVYLGLGPNRPSFWNFTTLWTGTKYLHGADTAESANEGPMAVDGSFTTTLPVDALYDRSGTTVDCEYELNGCAVLTRAAHGWGPSNRTQDAIQPLTFFTPAPPEDEDDDTPKDPTPQPRPQPQPPVVQTPAPPAPPAPIVQPQKTRPTVAVTAIAHSRIRFRVSEAARVTLKIQKRTTRRVRRNGKRVVVTRWTTVKTVRSTTKRGGTFTVNPKLKSSGRYRVLASAVSTATSLKSVTSTAQKTLAAAKAKRR